ncbi:MAG: hypothetical protein WBE26_16645, partial [Phycisphaerae bacterium]
MVGINRRLSDGSKQVSKGGQRGVTIPENSGDTITPAHLSGRWAVNRSRAGVTIMMECGVNSHSLKGRLRSLDDLKDPCPAD